MSIYSQKKIRVLLPASYRTRRALVLGCVIIVVFLVIIGFRDSEQVEAQINAYGNVHGWAWSDNIGWISFNCYENPGIGCALSPYGVMMDSGGDLVGDAWSDNIGWIKFGGFSVADFPTGSGTTSTNANLSGGALTGWAKAIGGAPGVSPYTQPWHHGGWDGWISLDGSQYDISYDSATDELSGFAWGDEVIGWISFSGTAQDGSPYAVTVDTEACVLGLTATPDTLSFGGGSVTLEWTGNNLDLDDGDCTVNWDTAVPAPDPIGTETVSITSAKTFFISCPCQDGGTATADVNVTVATEENGNGNGNGPTSYLVGMYLKADPDLLECTTGATTNLTWGITDSWAWGEKERDDPGLYPYPIDINSPCEVSWNGTVSAPPVPPNSLTYTGIASNVDVSLNTGSQYFSIKCFDIYGEPVFSEEFINCIITDPVLDLEIEGGTNVKNDSGLPDVIELEATGGNITLTWSSDDVDSCMTESVSVNNLPSVATVIASNYSPINIGESWDTQLQFQPPSFTKEPTPTTFFLPEETYGPIVNNTGFFMRCKDDNGNFAPPDTVIVWVDGDDVECDDPSLPSFWCQYNRCDEPNPPFWCQYDPPPPPPLEIPRFEER